MEAEDARALHREVCEKTLRSHAAKTDAFTQTSRDVCRVVPGGCS